MRVAEIAGKRFQLQNQIVWVKSITVDGESHGHFNPIAGDRFLNRQWESIFHFTKTGKVPLDRLAIGVPYTYEVNVGRTGATARCGGDVWFCPYETITGEEERSDHPATFSPEVAERCLKLAGIKPRMKVLDPFCGVNGMIAANRLGILRDRHRPRSRVLCSGKKAVGLMPKNCLYCVVLGLARPMLQN